MRGADRKKVRPSQLQKLCKAYDGSGDPYDHVARFRQVLYAEEVEDMHTMVQGFGLTLEGKALSWFQSLGNSVLYDFEVLVGAFIKENTKTGIKHNTLTQILDFKQKERETVKDAIVRLKSLVSRCPPREMPAEDRLISCFLEGLRDRNLHMQLFGQKHVRLNECFDDALLYEDNCGLGGATLRDEGTDGSSHTSRHVNSEAIADLVLKKMRQEGRMNPMQRAGGYPRAYVCGICSGNHPTGICQREGNALPSGLIWCDICKKYGTHGSDSCYYRARVLNQLQQQQHQPRIEHTNYQNRGNPSVGGNVERPIPVLGTQPPLPGAAAVRYVDVSSQEGASNQDIVPVGTYYEEEYNYNDYYSDPMIDDYQQLMVVGGQRPRPNNFARGQPPMGRGQGFSTQGVGPCFKCGGDHWARDCPKERSGVDWPRVERFCPGCHIDHLSKDCPNKPATTVTNGPPTSSLNYVEIIPSPPVVTGRDEIASLGVITRAQARSGIPMENANPTKPSSKKRRRRKRSRKSASAKSQDEIYEGDKKSKALETTNQRNEDDEKTQDEGGSVTIDQVDDPLRAAKLAMEGRVALKEKLPTKLTEYPCAVEEAANLQFHRRLVEYNQELLEGPPPSMIHKLPPFMTKLEPIKEKSENDDLEPNDEDQFGISPDSEEELLKEPEGNMEPESIPSLDENLATQLWEEVREKLKSKDKNGKSPLSTIALSREWNDKDDERLSPNSDWERSSEMASEDSILKILPEYVGDYETKSEIVPLPTTNIPIHDHEKDVSNLQALMSAPVTCTIPLADLLKIRPNLWENVAGLSKVGEFCKKHNIETEHVKRKINIDTTNQVPLNKVSLQTIENEVGNTTLPVEFNDYKAIAILDTGAGVSIATKSMWEKWGKLALRRTRMQLQLADGKMAKPLGMLEHVTVTSCGIAFEHTFAIVDFGRDPNYEIILGRPFMRQLLVIQDWGYNYLYLRHDGVTTRVNLSTHEFRDVAKLPIAEFESATTSKAQDNNSNYEGEDNLWLFEAEEREQRAYQAIIMDQEIEDLDKIYSTNRA